MPPKKSAHAPDEARYEAAEAKARENAEEIIRLHSIVAETPTKEQRQASERFLTELRSL
jgi:hypothetical protein